MSPSWLALANNYALPEGGLRMYATSSSISVFHLVIDAANPTSTLCGLRVVPIVIDRPAKSDTLYLTSKKPAGYVLCKECSKIDRQEKGPDMFE